MKLAFKRIYFRTFYVFRHTRSDGKFPSIALEFYPPSYEKIQLD